MTSNVNISKTSMKVGAERYFQDQLDAGCFMLQRSRSSGVYVFYPRARARLPTPDSD
ncbi:MAG: hypothetical protein HYX63_10480 [Gammaproteobacteria bacterium]|nr:hypothetical protein [Gammaproteobacteria bacterium]